MILHRGDLGCLGLLIRRKVGVSGTMGTGGLASVQTLVLARGAIAIAGVLWNYER